MPPTKATADLAAKAKPSTAKGESKTEGMKTQKKTSSESKKTNRKDKDKDPEMTRFNCHKPYRASSRGHMTKTIPLGSERYSYRKNRSDRPYWGEEEPYDRYDQFEEDIRNGRN